LSEGLVGDRSSGGTLGEDEAGILSGDGRHRSWDQEGSKRIPSWDLKGSDMGRRVGWTDKCRSGSWSSDFAGMAIAGMCIGLVPITTAQSWTGKMGSIHFDPGSLTAIQDPTPTPVSARRTSRRLIQLSQTNILLQIDHLLLLLPPRPIPTFLDYHVRFPRTIIDLDPRIPHTSVRSSPMNSSSTVVD